MMRKRLLACLLALTMLFLSACGNMSGRACKDVSVYGSAESKDPLRICIDLFHTGAPDLETMDEFLYRLEHTAGITDVIIEYIPSQYDENSRLRESSVRATALDRLRAEIMAGGGPDVFIMQYHTGVNLKTRLFDFNITSCLFKYPEKAMENGIFLPLDEYIENNTRFTEWDKLTQPVLRAGRNEEGQQLIPLNYTLPLLCCPKTEGEHIPDKKYTWDDMLTNPELLPYSLDLANCGAEHTVIDINSTDKKSETYFGYSGNYIPYIFGVCADYKEEEMIVSEAELAEVFDQIMSLDEKDSYAGIEQAEEIEANVVDLSSEHFNKSMIFMPVYSRNGGVLAEIESFAAVNRNTKKPEEAFAVIDLLMSKNFQQTSRFYNELCSSTHLPLHEELLQEATPMGSMMRHMTEANYAAFSKVREQITGAYFESEGSTLLSYIFSSCRNPLLPEDKERPMDEVLHEKYLDMARRVKE